jgi:hypothetical protein
MRVHNYTLGTRITRTGEFEKKGLATHAVNVGTRRDRECVLALTTPSRPPCPAT